MGRRKRGEYNRRERRIKDKRVEIFHVGLCEDEGE